MSDHSCRVVYHLESLCDFCIVQGIHRIMDLFHGGILIILSSSQHPHLYLLMTAPLFIRTCITSSLYRGVDGIIIPKPSGLYCGLVLDDLELDRL